MIRSFIKIALPLFVLASTGCAADATEEAYSPDEQEAVGEAVHAVTFAVPNLHTTFFAPPHAGSGNNDFSGHGPLLSFGLNLAAEGNELVAYINIDAIETQSDWTRVAGTQRQVLYTAPSPITLVPTQQPQSFTWQYTDTNHNPDGWGFPEPTVDPKRLVKFLSCVGDTSGDDVWKTGCYVDLHPITIQY